MPASASGGPVSLNDGMRTSADGADPGRHRVHTVSLLEHSRPLARSFGRVLEARPGERLSDLDREQVLALYREYGALLFAGFAADREQFQDVTERFSRGFSTYQGGFFFDRRPIGDDPTVLTVTASDEGFAIPLHGEMYYTRQPPGVLWFGCETPPAEDGETTVCDGEDIYRRLSDCSRSLFAEQRVRYTRQLPDGVWQSTFQTDDPKEMERYCQANDTRLTVDEETGDVTTEYLSWAFARGRSGQRDTFINNVIALYLGELSFERGTVARAVRDLASEKSFQIRVRMEDGSRVPGAVVKEIMALNRRHAALVSWQRGDVLMVDNTRILHGRRAYTGARDIHVRLAEQVVS